MQSRTTARIALFGLLAAAGCQEYGYTSTEQVDVFQQRTKNAVDLLLVVDNSCSMQEEQDNLARNFDALLDTFAEAEVDWQLAVTTTDAKNERWKGRLQGGDDEIQLAGAFGTIDRVAYDRTWGFEAGVALSLDPSSFGPTINDDREDWCPATDAFGGGQGTPGAWNPSCDGSAANPPSGGTDDGPRAAKAGDLVVTEIMAESSGRDALCEWMELTNLSDDTVLLDEILVTDDGNNEVVLPAYEAGPYEAAVIGRSTDTSENCDTPVDIAVPTGWVLADDRRVIRPDTEDPGEAFSELVAQGTIGAGTELGLHNAMLVFEEPYYSESNETWLRDEANLSILFVSDEDDKSPEPVDFYVRAYTDLKGDRAYRDRSIVNLSAVVGVEPPPSVGYPSCQSENGLGEYGARYLDAVAETRGIAESICAEDFAPIVNELGLTLSGLEADFHLSGVPNLDTLTVELYSGEDFDTFERELNRDQDFTYVADGNYLHFEEEQLPPSDWFVVATYIQLPDSAAFDTDEEGS